MQDLGTLGGEWSFAQGINDLGQVVGFSQVANGKSHAFVWNSNDGMVDLDSLGGDSQAWAINKNGSIVGYSLVAPGVTHAVLWQPVPEPSSILALLCGIGGLGGMLRLKRR